MSVQTARWILWRQMSNKINRSSVISPTISHTPHFRYPTEFYDPFRDKPIEMLATNPNQEDIDRTRAALALCENIDWNVGRLMDKLDALGIAEDTIVFYFGDNGPNGARWNGGMKGTKGSDR